MLVFDKTIPLGLVDGEVLNHTVGIDNEDTLGTYNRTELDYTLSTALGPTLFVPGEANDGMIGRSGMEVALQSSDKLVLGSDEGVKLESTDCELFSSLPGVDNGGTLGIDEGVHLVSSNGFFDGSNESVQEGSLHGCTL